MTIAQNGDHKCVDKRGNGHHFGKTFSHMSILNVKPLKFIDI